MENAPDGLSTNVTFPTVLEDDSAIVYVWGSPFINTELFGTGAFFAAAAAAMSNVRHFGRYLAGDSACGGFFL